MDRHVHNNNILPVPCKCLFCSIGEEEGMMEYSSEIRIHRGKYEQDFTILPNILLQSTHLSLRAKGLLFYFLSLPANFKIRVNKVIELTKESKHVIYSIFEELKEAGHLEKIEMRDKGRITGVYYNIYAIPAEKEPFSKNHEMDNTSENSKDTEQTEKKVIKDEAPFPKNQEVVQGGNEPFPVFSEAENSELKKRTLQNNNIYKNINNQKAAAIIINPENAAAILCDSLIDEQLSDNQLLQVRKIADQYSKHLPANEAELTQGLIYELLDVTSFRRCDQIFAKKLKAIENEIRKGKWSLPAGMQLHKKNQMERNLEDLKAKLRQAKIDCQFWSGHMAIFNQRGDEKHSNHAAEELTKSKQAVQKYEIAIETAQGAAN